MTIKSIYGVFDTIESTEYHSMPGVSNSMLSAMAKSPAHCFALYLDPDRPASTSTAAMAAGTLAHCAILEPRHLPERYAIKPEGHSGATKQGKLWADEHQHLIAITETQHAAAMSQRDAVMRVDELAVLLARGKPELSAFWTDDATGLQCRCRPDWTHDHGDGTVTLVDVKKTTDSSPEGFSKAVANYGYHRQAWHYSRGFERASGKRVRRFVFAAVSSAYPFVAAAYVLDDETEMQACEEVGELLALYASCEKSGNWPAYGNGAHIISLPAWARRSTEVEISYV